jgi:hypothetical protein
MIINTAKSEFDVITKINFMVLPFQSYSKCNCCVYQVLELPLKEIK